METTQPPAINFADRFPVVGVGASAGGLEAVTSLLKELAPNLGIGYVIVLHLDPARDSAAPEILGRATHMPVVQATDAMRVEADHVYVIPPNCEMTIEDGVLHLHHRVERRSGATSVDTFLRSLATAHGSDSIGIILSGTASDGTLGLEAIKGEGGITFAQEPTSAKYDGMPASAIASGCVDFVLTPVGIAQEIARIRQHPYIADRLGTSIRPEDESEMEQIFRLLRRVTTVDFSHYKLPTIARRIQRRMALQKLEKLKDYAVYLHHNRLEIEALYKDLLINVTSFFPQSRGLRRAQATRLPKHPAGAHLQLWPDSHLGARVLDWRGGLFARHLHRRISGGRTVGLPHPGVWHRPERQRYPTRPDGRLQGKH